MTTQNVCCEKGLVGWPIRNCLTHTVMMHRIYFAKTILLHRKLSLWRIWGIYCVRYSKELQWEMNRFLYSVFSSVLFSNCLKIITCGQVTIFHMETHLFPFILSMSQISSHKRFFVCLSGAQNVRWAVVPVNFVLGLYLLCCSRGQTMMYACCFIIVPWVYWLIVIFNWWSLFMNSGA